MSGNDGGVDLLEIIAAKVEAGHDKSAEELKTTYKNHTDVQLQDQLRRNEKLVAEGQLPRSEILVVKIAEIKQEIERRKLEEPSKRWLAQVWFLYSH